MQAAIGALVANAGHSLRAARSLVDYARAWAVETA
jgi:hypothetical protein